MELETLENPITIKASETDDEATTKSPNLSALSEIADDNDVYQVVKSIADNKQSAVIHFRENNDDNVEGAKSEEITITIPLADVE